MRRTAFMLALTLAGGVAVGMIGDRIVNALPKPVKRTVLLRTDLAGIEGQEAVMAMVELGPGSAIGRHWHPGHVFLYTLEGLAILEREGRPPTTLKPGDTMYIAPRLVHNAKNPSKTTAVKAVEFTIERKGEPFSVRLE